VRVRLTALITALGAAFILVGLLSGPAAAGAASTGGGGGSDEPIVISGTLRNTAEDNEPVPDVTITVSRDGEELGSAVSNDDGQFEISFQADPGPVQVELDTETLPEGVDLREGAQNPLTLQVRQGDPPRFINFSIGPDVRDVETWVDRLPQVLWEGFYFGVILALGALGLSVIFGTTGLTNFSHGELLTFGAMMAYWFNHSLGLTVIVAGFCAILASAAFGLVQHEVLWRPLRRRATSLVSMMVVTIGLALVLRNVFQIRTGGRTVNYDQYVTQDPIDLGPITVSPRDLVTLGLAALTIVVVSLALSRTRLGKATRAVADNPALSSATGINVDSVIRVVWVGGAALAGMSGFFLAAGIGVNFQLGAQLLLLLFAAVTLGGLGTIWGAMIGAVIVGVFVEVSTLVIPSELKYAGALFVLIAILLVRPQGLLGRRERIG
jgi:branched-chain amino acid transport system permease protein